MIASYNQRGKKIKKERKRTKGKERMKKKRPQETVHSYFAPDLTFGLD